MTPPPLAVVVAGSAEQLGFARHVRRQWGLWNYLDDPRGPHGDAFQLPRGRALRLQLLEAVKTLVEDPEILGQPISLFMTDTNRPISLRWLIQHANDAPAAAGAGGGALVADPEGPALLNMFQHAFRQQRVRPPVPPPPAPPAPLPPVHAAVVAPKKGVACKRCARLLPQGAPVLLLQKPEQIFVLDQVSGQQMGTAFNKITKGATPHSNTTLGLL